MKAIEIFSPAKINLFLHVTGKREDGYHLLHMLMCRLAFGDMIRLSPLEKSGVTVSCDHPDVPETSANIAVKAAQEFFKMTGKDDGFHIDIQKKIPVGAGLGGGSSNAASVLLALNKHYNHPLSKDQLMAAGLRVGADVPFFIFEKTAIAKGVGEVLERCDSVAKSYVLLIYPGLHVSTGEVYKKLNFGLTKDQKKNKNHFFCLSKDHFCARKHLWNDLEKITFEMYPEIHRLKGYMLSLGADGALMSGSGSTVFGLFSDEGKAESAYNTVKGKIGDTGHTRWQVILTELML